MNRKKLLLIDGNSLFFKSFYATYQQLKNNSKGSRNQKNEPINALRTFANMIVNLKQKYNDYSFLVAFDERGTETYRHKHDFYKANRTKQPDDLYIQIPFVKDFLDLFGITWYANKYYEADDVIGILANRHKKDHEIIIISTDKDLLQLVDNNVKVYLSKSGISDMEEYNIENFKQKNNNLNPSQIPDLKAIMGDNSDNLKGIPGIGPKGAISLLSKFNTIEELIENIDKIEGNIKDKISLYKQEALLCKSIATIMAEGDVEIDINYLDKHIDWNALKEFLTDKNVFSILKRIEEIEDAWTSRS